MPPPKHRRKPFSAKQKKDQLQNKRDRIRCRDDEQCEEEARQRSGSLVDNGEDLDDTKNGPSTVTRLNQQPVNSSQKYDPNKYRLHFTRDTNAEVERRKVVAAEPLESVPEERLEVDVGVLYPPEAVFDIPKRQPWDYNTSKATLTAREEAYFMRYLDNLLMSGHSDNLSYFELNLETWRQLWRVLEISDIILLITDIRHPVLHFSPAFYHHVTVELQKPLLLVLNKIDLAPPSLVVAWQRYFQEKFPNVRVICFTSFPKESGDSEDAGKVSLKRRTRQQFGAVGPQQLLKACQDIVQGQVELGAWQEQIASVSRGEQTPCRTEAYTDDDTASSSVRYRDGILTIGCCGYPNVGKSSLMNGLMGKKVVSVSKTPGHTKHFQTIYLTPTVRLCDCPGLVFPSVIPKPLQILAGIYPIAQVREPYNAVGFLAARMPLIELLRISHPEAGEHPYPPRWSALDICDAWAKKRGFLTAKAARHDLYRAANHILRLAVEGRICLCMRPPDYTHKKGEWESDPATQELARLQIMQTHREPDSEISDLTDSGSDGDTSDHSQIEGSDGDQPKPASRSFALSNPFALLADD